MARITTTARRDEKDHANCHLAPNREQRQGTSGETTRNNHVKSKNDRLLGI
jgi:hypothetical protein